MHRLATLFEKQRTDGAFSAGQLVVRRGGAIVFEHSTGELGSKEGEPGSAANVTPETRFQVMSASKPVVAAAIAWLEEQGQLNVDCRVAELWPEFGAHGKADVTVLDVLLHRSGLLTPAIDAAPELWASWESLTDSIAAQQLTTARGTQAYNPLAFGWILAEVVRRVSGVSLPEFVRAKFPSELAGLEFLRSPGATTLCARTLWRGPARLLIGGNDIAPRFEQVNNEISGVSALVPGAGMFTNARTLALFYETLARGGKLPSGQQWLSPETVRRYTARVSTRWDRSVGSSCLLAVASGAAG